MGSKEKLFAMVDQDVPVCPLAALRMGSGSWGRRWVARGFAPVQTNLGDGLHVAAGA